MTCSVRISGRCAADVRAERQTGGGLLGGLGGYGGAQQYVNQGGGGLLGGLGGLGGYRGAPAYGNTGYGQPNGGGSMLAPLLQYIR